MVYTSQKGPKKRLGEQQLAIALSFICWNLENFHNDNTRVNRVVDAIAVKNPDLFGICEVKGTQNFSTAMSLET